MDYSEGSLLQARIDLHTHSTASDGRLSPAQLVDKATKCGVKLLALTDHDTIGGLNEARKAASAHGIQLVSGVELSAGWHRHSIHIIGLDFDAEGQGLTSGLRQLRGLRTQRAIRISEKLEGLGVTGAVSWTSEKAASAQITRAHFACLLVKRKYCRTVQQAFRQYLAPGKLVYADCDWPSMGEVLNWIKESNGVAVLAHPLRYGMEDIRLTQLLHDFKAAGGDAVEIYSGVSSPKGAALCTAYAQRFNLKGSIGSDYHGDTPGRSRLGVAGLFPPAIQPVWESFR